MKTETNMEKGRVIKANGGFFFVETSHGLISTKMRGKLKKNTLIVPGDLVNVSLLSPDEGVIEQLAPRFNLLPRPPLANVDRLMIIMAAAEPDFHAGLLDKFLIMAEWANIPQIIIVINKTDLTPIPPILRLYEQIGYQVIGLSAKGRRNTNRLADLATGGLTALTGPSGVGKSSLLNTLNAAWSRKIGEVSEKIRRGRHTTRLTELLPYRDGYIIDTPGFSAIDMKDADKFTLAACFPEFRSLIGRCKFSPCEHTHEPDCAIKAAVASGSIAESRYNSYLQIIKGAH